MKTSTLPLIAAVCLAATAWTAHAAEPVSATPSVLPARASVAPVPDRSGIVKLVNGSVSAVGPQGEKRTLKPGDPVAVTDQVLTGPDSAASQLEIKGFTFDAAKQEGNLFLSVLRGTMRMITGLIGKGHPEAVKINTPTSLIGVLGTDFIVKAEGAL
jgi:hypothetical protein